MTLQFSKGPFYYYPTLAQNLIKLGLISIKVMGMGMG